MCIACSVSVTFVLEDHISFRCELAVSKQPQFLTVFKYSIGLDICIWILHPTVNTSWFTKITRYVCFTYIIYMYIHICTHTHMCMCVFTELWRSSHKSRLTLGFILWWEVLATTNRNILPTHQMFILVLIFQNYTGWLTAVYLKKSFRKV